MAQQQGLQISASPLSQMPESNRSETKRVELSVPAPAPRTHPRSLLGKAPLQPRADLCCSHV